MKTGSSFSFIRVFTYAFVTCHLCGCFPQTPNEIVQDWMADGWSQVASHGETGPMTRHSVLRSKQAQSVEASWVERGRRKTKLYRQQTHFHMVIRFFKEDGDQFAVVMKKRK